MGEWREIPELLRLTKTDVAVWVVTFALTVFADLTVAVDVGMVLAALLFIRRVADTTTVSMVTDEYVREGHAHILQNKEIPRYVRIIRIHGPFLFGATDKLHVVYDNLDALPEIVLLRLRNMTAHRCDGPARDRGAGRGDAAVRPASDSVRRASPARAADCARGLPSPRRRSEHLRAPPRRAGTRRAAASGTAAGDTTRGGARVMSSDLQAVKAQFFKALANPVRIRLLEKLVQRETKVQDLQKALNLEQPIVSQQLARLRASGIVVSRKRGRRSTTPLPIRWSGSFCAWQRAFSTVNSSASGRCCASLPARGGQTGVRPSSDRGQTGVDCSDRATGV